LDFNTYLDFTSLVEPVPIRAVLPSRASVRSDIGNLNELVASIRSIGLIHPILLRPTQEGDRFEVVAGNRRFEACKILRWTQIPSVIREMSEKEAYEVALIENIQRKSMNPIEEARALKRYVDKEGWGGVTHLAEKLGKSKSYISQRILLLSLPTSVQEQLRAGEMKPSTARQLYSVDDPEIQEEIADKVSELKLSTRSTMHLIESLKKENRAKIDRIEEEKSYPDFESSTGIGKRSNHTSISALQQVILAMRLTLARLDIVREKCEKEEPEVAKYIHELRLEIHNMIDDCIRKKMRIAHPLNEEDEEDKVIMRLESS
jgi:ParB family chromosome partitioning protein